MIYRPLFFTLLTVAISTSSLVLTNQPGDSGNLVPVSQPTNPSMLQDAWGSDDTIMPGGAIQPAASSYNLQLTNGVQ